MSMTEKISNKNVNDNKDKKEKRSYKKKIIVPENSFILKNASLICNGNFILKSKNENITNELNKLIKEKDTKDSVEVNNDNIDNQYNINYYKKGIKKLEKKIEKKELIIINY
jgi:hypothetical protein